MTKSELLLYSMKQGDEFTATEAAKLTGSSPASASQLLLRLARQHKQVRTRPADWEGAGGGRPAASYFWLP